ncbi:DUF5687 family protein [Flagellimonas meridianipacifica]|uniref:ABC-2 type transport system permease protein n=1 Tax=Flagellimonas meridianipacifica TaxID=1080225 RepID=A0A2T0MHB1_9FLAO|nr:DUF5687 family protein [Allomuricauda pacifica]PRX56969.1 hypothetical protein CLV81_0970 [Allomuricauda pacifica]
MFKHFIRLQWKSFFRSSSFGKGIALKILMIFFGLYMLAALVITGSGIYFVLQELFPDQSPMWTLNQYLVYWILMEMFFRYFLQKLPVMDIKPFLIVPIHKSKITHYILGRSGVSIYNLFAIFFFLPFAIVLLFKGYAALNVLLWLLSIFAIVLCINYVNFLINKSDKALFVIIGLILTFYALDYFQIVPIKEFFGPTFHGLYAYPLAFLAPIGLAFIVYWLNYRFLRNRLFLDDSLKTKKQEAKSSDLAWTRRFGDIAPFLQLDLKLIWRNKRTKAQVFISLLFVFYGLIFYTQDIYANMMPMFAFLGIFMTGIFLANFGQFIPAWDSAYYSMMMSQNIPLRKYLDSKAGLISVSVVVMFLLTIPYVYFGWEALAINFGSALYNLGVNIPVILYFGSFNKKRIELDKSPFGNMQGTSGTQFLIMLPVLGAPILIFTIFHFIFSVEVAVAVLSIMGIVGFMFKNKLLDAITEQYRKKKYGMIAGFKEKNS